MQDAVDWFADQLQDVAGREIVYIRGSTETAPFVASVASTSYEVADDMGVLTSFAAFDWTIRAANIVLNNVLREPRLGDYIRETLNGVEVRYEVLPIGSMPCFSWLDTSGALLLVHTKR